MGTTKHSVCAQTVDGDKSYFLLRRAPWSYGPSARTVRPDRPYGRSVRTVRTDGPYGPSDRVPPVRFSARLLAVPVNRGGFSGFRFGSAASCTGSSPGVGDPPPFSTSTVAVGPAAQNPFKSCQITKIISKANEDQREKDWAKGLSQGLGQGSHLRPLAWPRAPPHTPSYLESYILSGGALGQGPEVGPLTQPLAQPLDPTLFSLIFVGF